MRALIKRRIICSHKIHANACSRKHQPDILNFHCDKPHIGVIVKYLPKDEYVVLYEGHEFACSKNEIELIQK